MRELEIPDGFDDPVEFHKRLRTEPEADWMKRGEKMALELFHDMSKRVPAYKEFLRTSKIDPSKIKTIDDFHNIPTIDKDNYLRKYPRNMLCWDGEFAKGDWTISTTSGSTGKPYYFPRQSSQDWQYAMMAELYLRSNFDIQNKKTLYVVAFPMGAWIGGVFTYEAIKIVAERGGYDLSVITPGINKLAVIEAVKQLADDYDQVIIGSYAPFLKDILDDGTRAGIDWKKLNVGFVFSAEAFSEDLRDYVAKVADINILSGTLNHYGTVDLGTMSHETPLSILARRKIFQDEDLLNDVLPEDYKQPTLTQYIPELFYFEEEENNLICSAYSGIPLVRYDLKDYGGVVSKKELEKKFKDNEVDLRKLSDESGITDTVWNLPFVYVYERNDFSVSYYAFIVYPDTVRRALLNYGLEHKITGKFTMLIDYNKEGRQQLLIHVELNHKVVSSKKLEKKVAKAVHDRLVHENSEYRETYSRKGDIVKPIVELQVYESQEYFKPGTKQKWVVKDE